MRFTLSQLLDEFTQLYGYMNRKGLTTSRKVMALNWAQEQIQDILESDIPDGDVLFVGRTTYTLDGTESFALPPNANAIKYAEFSDDQDTWAQIWPLTTGDRALQGRHTESTLLSTGGFVRIWYPRRLSPLASFTAASGTSATQVVFPTPPTASAYGAFDPVDDAYNGATLVGLTGGAAGVTGEITDYDGASTTATVAMAGATAGDTMEFRSDMDDRYQRVLLQVALTFVAPDDRVLDARAERAIARMATALHGRMRQHSPWMRGRDERREEGASVGYFLWGNTIRFVDV